MGNERPKIYICSECGFVFNSELSELIENNIRVYCEQCGAPFNLEGRNFQEVPYQKGAETRYDKKAHPKETGGLDKAIQVFNILSFLPLLIYAIITLMTLTEVIGIPPENLISFIFSRLTLGLAALLIVVYDIRYIYPRVKERIYTGIIADAFIMGILGCIIYGTGTILLIKGILIIIKILTDREVRQRGIYDFGVKLKNSFNNLSTRAGFVILLIGWADIFVFNQIYTLLGGIKALRLPFLIANVVFTIITIVVLIIDWSIIKKIKKKQHFEIHEFIGLFILGFLGSLFYAAGIIIIFKAIIILFLSFGTPPVKKKLEPRATVITREESKLQPVIAREEAKPLPPSEMTQEPVKVIPEARGPVKPIQAVSQPSKEGTINEVKEEISKPEEPEKIEKPEKSESKQEKVHERELEQKLRLHESLLPVKNDKDRDLVKKYFTKIFIVLSKDIRKRIHELNLPKDEKKELVKEMAFLTKEKQIEYLDAINDLYREIPEKVINRIKSLPNLKPNHYEQIINQLKYMDDEEQLSFVTFLEKKA